MEWEHEKTIENRISEAVEHIIRALEPTPEFLDAMNGFFARLNRQVLLLTHKPSYKRKRINRKRVRVRLASNNHTKRPFLHYRASGKRIDRTEQAKSLQRKQ